MRAIRIHRYGGPEVMVLEQAVAPRPGPGEVLLRIGAAGVNPRDIMQRQGQLGGELPLILGGEASGFVEAVGPGVTAWQPGEAAAGRVTGAYAEFGLARADRVFRKPASLTHVEAAGLTIAWVTAAHGLFTRGRLRPGETVLVRGASGGTGLAAVSLGVRLGARVLGVVGSERKAVAVRERGGEALVVPRDSSLLASVQAVTGGVDVIFDGVVGPLFGEGLQLLRERGRYLVHGAVAGSAATFDIWQLTRRGAEIIGYSLTSDPTVDETYRRWDAELLPAFETGALQPLPTEALPLDRAADAQRLLQAGDVVGKLCLIP